MSGVNVGAMMNQVTDYLEGMINEKFIIEKIKLYADYRTKALEPVDKFSPFFENSAIFQLVVWVGAIALVSILYAEIRAITLFSLHPVCMIIGSLIFMAEGVVSYRNNAVLSAFAPIMAGSKRNKRFSIHRTLHIMGFAFLVLGFLFILSNKARNGFTILPHTFHAVFGLAALLLAVFQGVVGARKLDIYMTTQTKTSRFHGGMGLLNWDLICASILLGFMEFLSLAHLPEYLLAMAIVAVSWFNVHAQMRAKYEAADGDKSSTASLLGREEESVAVLSAGSMRDPSYSRGVDLESNFRSATNSAANSDDEADETQPKDGV